MNDRPLPDAPAAWMERAYSDLVLARVAITTPDVLREDACFHAQQCAEKALKALLVRHRIPFPRTHVVELLLDLLKSSGVVVPPDVDEAVALTQYAVQARYPGDWEPITQAEAASGLDLAARVHAWVREQLG